MHDFWRLDYWEDDLRRRRRFIRNPFGSTHLDITCKSLEDYGQYFRQQPIKTLLESVSPAHYPRNYFHFVQWQHCSRNGIHTGALENLRSAVGLGAEKQFIVIFIGYVFTSLVNWTWQVGFMAGFISLRHTLLRGKLHAVVFNISAVLLPNIFLIDPYDRTALPTAQLSIWLCVTQQRL